MAQLLARTASTWGTTDELNASTRLMVPGETWLAIDGDDADHQRKTCFDPDGALFSDLDWDTFGSGTGSGVPDDIGPKTFLYDADTPGQPKRVDGPTLAEALNLALYDSDDDSVTTLASVGQALADFQAIGVTDLTQPANGLWPAAVYQANLLNCRVKLYTLPTVTAIPPGFAATGVPELLAIGSGTNKGLWYRDDAHIFERIAPGEAFTPIARLPVLGAGNAQTTWTPASGNEELFGVTRNRLPVRVFEDDGTSLKYQRISVAVNRVVTAGVAGLKLRAAYYDGSALVDITGAEVPLDATGTKISTPIDLPGGVYTRETSAGFTELALRTIGGNGSTAVGLVGAYIDVL